MQAFKPETVTAYEAGFKSSLFDRAVTFNLAAFYNDYRNQQVQVLVPSPIPGEPSFFALDNAKKSRVYGIDADLTIRPTSELTLMGQLGLLNSRLKEFVSGRDPTQPDYSGNKLAQAPSTSLTLSADWRKPLGDNELTLHWDSNYRSTMFFDPSNNPYTAQPSYWLHNARISFSLKDGRYELGAFARNLTKKKYLVWNADLSDPFGVLTAIVGTPRIFGVDFNYKY